MKRSSSKLISKAGSVRNINKAGFKFNFELHVESVDKVMGPHDVVVTWERGSKLLCTKPAKVDKATRVATFGGEVLAQEITLFKKKKDGANFDSKVFKLCVRQNSERGKVVGRIEIDFAEYVEIPSFNKRVGASISSGGRIVLRVVSTYIGEAKARRSSRGTASVGSRDPESDGQSAAAFDEEDERSELENDINLDDLDLNDDAPVPQAPLPPVAQTLTKNAPTRGRLRSNTSAPAEESQSSSRGGRFLRKVSEQSPKHEVPSSVSVDTAPVVATLKGSGGRGRSSDSEVGATNVGVPSKAEFEKLRRENRLLKRRNDDLMQRNTELENRIQEQELDESAESVEQLMIENSSLKRDVDDLEARLAREPVYADVVRELREAKMALAILSLEKDELIQELRSKKGGR